MAISSAMYAAVTGLSALGTGMQTISNNIANVNTVGFKAGRTNYEDLISQNYFSGGANGVNQRGCGVKVSTIQNLFSQGAFMSSGQDTDMAIAGDGFFAVRHAVTNEVMYTRAGNFTINKEGYMQDPSGHILQGWQMSIPKPGEDAVKIGASTDVKITVLNAPPVETSEVKLVVNLNADDKTAFRYKQYPMAADMADRMATSAATAARPAAELAVWNPLVHIPVTKAVDGAYFSALVPSPNNARFNELFVQNFNNTYGANVDVSNLQHMSVVDDVVDFDADDRTAGKMTTTEYNYLITATITAMAAEAKAAGDTAEKMTYDTVYKNTEKTIVETLGKWQAEGNGFAAAWDARQNPPMDPENYTFTRTIPIYDSLGSEHNIYVYYQPNPHMDNVWDYVICTDPIDDARLDSNNAMLMDDNASFSGLIQKGKITFTSDGPDRHGGVIKDIEAQNLDLSKTKMAVIGDPQYNASTATFRKATIGGYYTGSPMIPTSGDNAFQYTSSARTYQLFWGAPVNKDDDPLDPNTVWGPNVESNPPTSGLTWIASDGSRGTIPIQDPNNYGPHNFGSGMTITFDQNMIPLRFGTPGVDGLSVTAESEQVRWTEADLNKEGYFNFDVAFVSSASMAYHPPYPTLDPIYQNVAMDMGAQRNLTGNEPKWILDESSTTQYAAKSSEVFRGQDGYPAGSLQRVSIGEDGVITGIYSNGRHQALYQIGLTKFLNPWGLSKEGDNLYSETRYSGAGALNEAGYGGTGTILGNFLEQSNVDLAEEIVNMIVTQRGFQANSKTVTTTDSMMAEIIEMKR